MEKVPLQLSPNAITVLEKRYLKKDANGRPVETPEEMFWRVAHNIAAADRIYDGETDTHGLAVTFYNLMASLDFLPNSPTLMNAGRELQQLSACFVLPIEDDLDSIFTSVRNTALIQQSGGGCVSGDSYVFTTFCGGEKIATLYKRIEALDLPTRNHPDHRVINVRSLGIRTFALDPATGRFQVKPITHLWRWIVPAEARLRVQARDGTEVTTSAWHPFLCFTPGGIRERRADELQPGDLLLTPNRSIRTAWPFLEPSTVEGFALSEPLAWLAGFTLGDGSLDWFQNRANRYRALRLRLFDAEMGNLAYATEVLASQGVFVTPNRDKRGLWRVTTTNQSFVPRFAKLLALNPGPKQGLCLPEWVAKSPLSIIGAFLAGLVDSDGYISVPRRRIEFSTVCPELAHGLVTLLSALGLNPSVREKPPGKKGKRCEFVLHFADAKRTPELAGMLSSWLRTPSKRERLADVQTALCHNTHPRIPLPFHALEGLLKEVGVPTDRLPIHKGPVRVGEELIWLSRAKWGQGIGEDTLCKLVKALRRILPPARQPELDRLEALAEGWAVVATVRPAPQEEPFYDFTVEGFNNYLAGGAGGKLTVVHNTGFSFSRLRPKNDMVKSTGGVASGPISFMRVFNMATEVIKQGGTRRGANMGILHVSHPDIEDFIDCKNDPTAFTNFNISVALSEDFMRQVEENGEYALLNPRSGELVRTIPARQIFDKIVANAWRSGEPGIVFLDRINRDNPTPAQGSIESTNPCGEQPLLPYEACNLGSINLAKMVSPSDGNAAIDWDRLRDTVHLAVHFLDNVIDQNHYPLPEIAEMARGNRKIGLGVMGWADLLVHIKVPYDSEEALNLAEKLMEFIHREGIAASVQLATSRGVFPHFEQSLYATNGPRLRNATITTIAPTGTLSILAGCSSGIEPLFAIIYLRTVMDKTQMKEINPYFEHLAKLRGFHSPELMHAIAERGSIRGLDDVPKDIQAIFPIAYDVSPESHLRMQAAFQRHTDNAVSKTVNFPKEATEQDVERVFLLAFREGCKGVTIYRDGSRQEQVLSIPSNGKKEKNWEEMAQGRHKVARERPKMTHGTTERVETPRGRIYVTVNEDEAGVCEVFVESRDQEADGLSRLISLALRAGVDPQEIIEQLWRCESREAINDFSADGTRVLVRSIAQGVALAMGRRVWGPGYAGPFSHRTNNGLFTKPSAEPAGKRTIGGVCPECGNTLEYVEGCLVCRYCGYSKCA